MASQRDYYDILGLKKDASESQIKSAYRQLALKYHPDRNKEKDAETKFKEINEAYQVLSDPKKRQTYDQFGHAAFDPSSGMGGNPFAGARQGPLTWTYTTGGPFTGGSGFNFGDTDFQDPFEIFEAFFGGGFTQAGRRRPRYSLTVDFMDAVKGADKEITVDGQKKKVKVPAGANEGTRIRFDQFDVTIGIRPHPRFKRDGYDLFIDHRIPFTMAALGGTTQVETVGGRLKLKVRPGTQSHTLVRLRGEGVPHLRRGGKGDLYVRLILDVPEKLSKAERTKLEEYRQLQA